VKNVLFASEMIGAVRGIDPTTGNYYDDTKRYIEASTILSAEDKHQIYEGNVRRVVVKQRGHTVAEFPVTVGVIGAVIAR